MTDFNLLESLIRFTDEYQKGNIPEDTSRFGKLMDEYEKKFNKFAPTEPGGFTEDQWCEIFETCIKENITVEELLGTDYDDDDCVY